MNAPVGAPAERMITLDVAILGREFKVACKESERAELTEAVGFLDKRMREIRDTGKVGGAERIAVMAALNLANELLRERRARTTAAIDGDIPRRRIQAMQTAIDQVLAGQEKLF